MTTRKAKKQQTQTKSKQVEPTEDEVIGEYQEKETQEVTTPVEEVMVTKPKDNAQGMYCEFGSTRRTMKAGGA